MYEALSRPCTSDKEMEKEATEAWELFRDVCERMDKQIQGMNNLVLQLVSPMLLHQGKNLLLAVPGQYNPTGPFPRIASFAPMLRVIQSKQHPRRISLVGSDGVMYKFLLKGHEDLRLDERVMQLLGLVNHTLESHAATKRRDFNVQLYSVTPLGDNAGLVGWVDNCNTLHAIIKDHREPTKTIGQEVGYLRSFCDDTTRLNATLIARVECFEWALENTEGNDLARSLWIHAPSAEVWLDRRTTYVRTLATMSMVGHILGLGDRHPSNLMIHAFSGRTVHIDFGDCFEVAMHRKTVPEKVPFRLTRMLVKAMEMGGIEGLFRHGCIAVMTMLRKERSSLLAMLEAFLHDPLVDWWRAENAAVTATGDELGMAGGVEHDQREFVGSIKSVVDRGAQRRFAPQTAQDAASKQVQSSRKAQKVLHRIRQKLTGKEFASDDQYASKVDSVSVDEQVARLVQQATSNENLCQHFHGWCAYW
jgi:FKBP12-rapamycin complex-associated protein